MFLSSKVWSQVHFVFLIHQDKTLLIRKISNDDATGICALIPHMRPAWYLTILGSIIKAQRWVETVCAILIHVRYRNNVLLGLLFHHLIHYVGIFHIKLSYAAFTAHISSQVYMLSQRWGGHLVVLTLFGFLMIYIASWWQNKLSQQQKDTTPTLATCHVSGLSSLKVWLIVCAKRI